MVVGEKKEIVEKNEMTDTIETVDIVREMKLWPDALTDILSTYLNVHPCKVGIETRLRGTRNFWQREQLSQASDTSKFTDRKYLWYYKVYPTSGVIVDWVLIVQGVYDAPNGGDFIQHRWANKNEPANWQQWE
jgi:hypothetical protein